MPQATDVSIRNPFEIFITKCTNQSINQMSNTEKIFSAKKLHLIMCVYRLMIF